MTDDQGDDTGEAFPRPPATITDGEDREIRIRIADSEDVEPLVGMYQAFDPSERAQGIPPVREEPIRRWLDTLFEADCLNVLAGHDGTPVGHATLVPEDEETYELAIFVLGEYQGAGIGTALLERLLGYAQEQEVEHVWLSVERWNNPAISLYETVGFEMRNTASFEIEMEIDL
jgi:ribosomal protein S18 acetylase RimI-like enzyme